MFKRVIGRTFLYLILSFGAFVVLLPLFWMLLTAFKQPGQALKYNFLPKTKAESVEYKIDARVKNLTIFEYYNKGAVSVALAGSMNSWNQTSYPMKNDGGIWTITLESLSPGKYEYKFILNGNEWISDPENKLEQNGNSLIVVKDGISSNKTLTNQTAAISDKIIFKYKNPSATAVSASIKNKGEVPLIKGDDGYWKAESPVNDGEVAYNFKYNIRLTDALGEIYTINNFTKVLFNKDFPFAGFFINSLIVAGLSAFFTVIICTMGGYAFAKKDFFLKDQLFLLLLTTMMIPGMIYMVPQFAIVSQLHWINTYKAMIIPHLANVFGLFLLRQYIQTIPNSLFEAAKVDGASEYQVFKNIVIPLSFPIMVTLFLLTFLSQWSNFLWQLIVNTPDSALRTLPVGLALFKGQYAIEWESMMAGACFSIIPIAILFLLAQKFFIEGMTSGAVKG